MRCSRSRRVHRRRPPLLSGPSRCTPRFVSRTASAPRMSHTHALPSPRLSHTSAAPPVTSRVASPRRLISPRRASQISTPLHWAASGGHMEAVRVLLAAGADKEAKAVSEARGGGGARRSGVSGGVSSGNEPRGELRTRGQGVRDAGRGGDVTSAAERMRHAAAADAPRAMAAANSSAASADPARLGHGRPRRRAGSSATPQLVSTALSVSPAAGAGALLFCGDLPSLPSFRARKPLLIKLLARTYDP